MMVRDRLHLSTILAKTLPGDEVRVDRYSIADFWPTPPYPREDDHLTHEERATVWLARYNAELFMIHGQPGFGVRINGDTARLIGGPFDGQTRPLASAGVQSLRLEEEPRPQRVRLSARVPAAVAVRVHQYVRQEGTSVFRYQE